MFKAQQTRGIAGLKGIDEGLRWKAKACDRNRKTNHGDAQTTIYIV